MKTAKTPAKPGSKVEFNEASSLVGGPWQDFALAAAFAVMRALKKVNPGDTYYEQYLGMKEKYGYEFFDTYALLWAIGVRRAPKRILEIGTRTGISLCQLLSSMSREALEQIQTIVCVDPFDAWTSPNLVRANLAHLNLVRPLEGRGSAPVAAETLEILAMKSEDYFNSAAGPVKPQHGLFDFILVDGDHSKPAARADLDAAAGLVESGGIIVFDDISTAPGECALIDVWEAWKAEHAEKFFFGVNMNGKGVAWAIRK